MRILLSDERVCGYGGCVWMCVHSFTKLSKRMFTRFNSLLQYNIYVSPNLNNVFVSSKLPENFCECIAICIVILFVITELVYERFLNTLRSSEAIKLHFTVNN